MPEFGGEKVAGVSIRQDRLLSVQYGELINDVISSCPNPAIDNQYGIIVPPGHEDESFRENPYIRVVYLTDNIGKTLDLSTTTTFKRSDGSNFIIDCTVAAEINSSGGAFSTGFTITILNIGIATITLDEMYDIQSGQRGTFTFDGQDFIGGV